MAAALEDMFWLPLPETLYGKEQQEHARQCGPYVCGLELKTQSLSLELLVRARSHLRCSCVLYADTKQRAFCMDWLDTTLRELDIPVT